MALFVHLIDGDPKQALELWWVGFYLVFEIIEDDIEAMKQALRLQHLIVQDRKQNHRDHSQAEDKDKTFEL
ncbi:hypothetical protein JFT66_15835 [Pseudomonas sp. MF6755]|uniref:hypothetical protein n=1 Tax=Pseudomonas sp. MF6755 TaxID=2797530 RepID=UPI0018E74ED3|nr:hypothetical protein [Pseudomonas sp. MF6755]MBJ2285628.1 hypothetical protein [Pseudomonas sp. MF6755]